MKVTKVKTVLEKLTLQELEKMEETRNDINSQTGPVCSLPCKEGCPLKGCCLAFHRPWFFKIDRAKAKVILKFRSEEK